MTGCPSDINATTDAGQPYATVNWTVPVYTDNVDSSINVTFTSSPLDQFSIGSIEVSYNGSDTAGNYATCIFTITVTGEWEGKEWLKGERVNLKQINISKAHKLDEQSKCEL